MGAESLGLEVTTAENQGSSFPKIFLALAPQHLLPSLAAFPPLPCTPQNQRM
jgi:hypothetical protein